MLLKYIWFFLFFNVKNDFTEKFSVSIHSDNRPQMDTWACPTTEKIIKEIPFLLFVYWYSLLVLPWITLNWLGMFIDIIVADQDTHWEILYVLLIGIIICGLPQALIKQKLHNLLFHYFSTTRNVAFVNWYLLPQKFLEHFNSTNSIWFFPSFW